MVKSIIIVFTFMAFISNFVGCGAKPYFAVESPKLAGAYIGTLENGDQITLNLRKEKDTTVGNGVYAGKDFAFIEENSKKITGRMTLSDGTTKLISIETSSNGKAVLETEGSLIQLEPSKTAVTEKSGPFSGYYETKELESFMNAINLVQYDKMISGNAVVLQQNILISGWTQSENNFIGYAILPDDAYMQFEAKLDGNKLIIDGIGKPTIFNRKEK